MLVETGFEREYAMARLTHTEAFAHNDVAPADASVASPPRRDSSQISPLFAKKA